MTMQTATVARVMALRIKTLPSFAEWCAETLRASCVLSSARYSTTPLSQTLPRPPGTGRFGFTPHQRMQTSGQQGSSRLASVRAGSTLFLGLCSERALCLRAYIRASDPVRRQFNQIPYCLATRL